MMFATMQVCKDSRSLIPGFIMASLNDDNQKAELESRPDLGMDQDVAGPS